MKLSQYAKSKSISYLTAYRHWRLGLIKGEQLASGTIVVLENQSLNIRKPMRAVLYTRVPNAENKSNLQLQLLRLRDFAAAKGYTITGEIREIGIDDNRPLLENIFKSEDWDVLVVEHKDMITRSGLEYLNIILGKQGKLIETINNLPDCTDNPDGA